MRITSAMFMRNAIARLFQNRADMMNTQERIASQKKIEKPSDNPVGFSRANRLREAYRQNKTFLKNVQSSQAWMDNTSSILDQLHQFAMSAVTDASHGLDAVVTDDVRQAIASQLSGILQESVSLLNSTYMGKNVFAGTETKMQKPFTQNGLDVTYSGNGDKIKRRISKQMVMDINVSGDELMATNFFSAMKETIEALQNGDQEAIKTAVDHLKKAEKNVLKVSTVYGSKISNLQLIKDRLISSNENLKEYISQEEDAVLEEELVKLKSQQVAYQATLQTTSDIMNLSILKYL